MCDARFRLPARYLGIHSGVCDTECRCGQDCLEASSAPLSHRPRRLEQERAQHKGYGLRQLLGEVERVNEASGAAGCDGDSRADRTSRDNTNNGSAKDWRSMVPGTDINDGPGVIWCCPRHVDMPLRYMAIRSSKRLLDLVQSFNDDDNDVHKRYIHVNERSLLVVVERSLIMSLMMIGGTNHSFQGYSISPRSLKICVE
jgi:hypothetical protein